MAIGGGHHPFRGTAGLAIGSFVIPAMIWTPILVAKEGKDAIEAAQKILTESQAPAKH